ncbi:MAG: ammonia-forming cytochrome c nitrite reductase subunit c552, partial [Calditrichaeota bacterium]|nr:ammonia-forming cytochrome c nitrite reductase subunit c552 [Calditrichota bacterium]
GQDAQVVQGYGHFGPHANPQADMMQGASAYHAVADPSFEWADPSHLNVENSCKTCHLSTKEFGAGPGGAAYTGHTFLPKVDACVGCHGAIADFDDIRALEDFDGDGSIEGIQSEVTGLIHLIEDALVATGLDTTGLGFEGALGDTTRGTFVQRGAGYNMLFVEEDKSLGVHNPDYAIQILQQSYQYLTGAPVPNAVILRKGEHKAVSKF